MSAILFLPGNNTLSLPFVGGSKSFNVGSFYPSNAIAGMGNIAEESVSIVFSVSHPGMESLEEPFAVTLQLNVEAAKQLAEALTTQIQKVQSR